MVVELCVVRKKIKTCHKCQREYKPRTRRKITVSHSTIPLKIRFNVASTFYVMLYSLCQEDQNRVMHEKAEETNKKTVYPFNCKICKHLAERTFVATEKKAINEGNFQKLFRETPRNEPRTYAPMLSKLQEIESRENDHTSPQ